MTITTPDANAARQTPRPVPNSRMRSITALCKGLAMALGALALGGLAADVASAETLLIRAGKAWTMVGEPIAPAMVLIRDGKIAEVAGEIAAPEDARVIEFKDAVVMPGLVSAYTQLGVAGGAAEFTREITPDFYVRSAIDWRSNQFQHARSRGITTAVIAPGTDNVFAGVACAAKTAGPERMLRDDLGLVITLASDARSRNRARTRPDSIFVRQPTNRMGVVWMLRSTLDRARRGDSGADPRILEALGGKRRLLCVSRTHFDIEAALRLADEFKLSPVLVGGEEAYRLADVLAGREVPVVLGPLATGSTQFGPEGTEPAWNRAGLLHAAGVRVALTGDDLLEQARFAVRFGLPVEAALAAITREPARILGIDERVGTLAVGRDADLLVLSGAPLEFTTQIEAVVVDGTVYQED